MKETPLQKARRTYVGKCGNQIKLGNLTYCEVSEKIIHPLMIDCNGHCTKKNCEYRIKLEREEV